MNLLSSAGLGGWGVVTAPQTNDVKVIVLGEEVRGIKIRFARSLPRAHWAPGDSNCWGLRC
jgi:hypothetical protein